MASSSDLSSAKVPYADRDPQEIAAFLRSIEPQSGKKKASIKKSVFKVPGYQNATVESWRMNDWDYKKPHAPMHARGLFTTHNSRGEPEIAVRGYDKFFNTGEVPETRWEKIQTNTIGPYELSLKENGCIIFVSGLEDGTLLVCSKHSTGSRADVDLSHAAAGERSLERQLEAVGKTKEDFARELRDRNVTAVAELCDDSFEEHILEYGPDKAGLYLHGVNLNVPHFHTYPSPQVQDFGRRWGFREVAVISMDDVAKVKEFLEDVAETGEWGGRAVEGFVVRCRMSSDPDRLPYHDWFFKYKFEEPYLMYRQWRECTKAMISGKPAKYKKHALITAEYLQFAKRRFAADPKLTRQYNLNHGIIRLRDDFLAFKNMKGADAANIEVDVQNAAGVHPEVGGNVMLVPVATIGCGKTTVALALAELFGWGHVQNDNIQGKGRPPRFVRECVDLLAAHPVVVADRNNAQRHERKQILTDVKTVDTGIKMVALYFVHNDVDKIREVTRARVIERGDNHQTIHVATDKDKFIGVMEGFLDRFEPVDAAQSPDHSFDAVVELDPAADSRTNLEAVVKELHRIFPNLVREVPTAEEMDDAVAGAMAYKPGLRHTIRDGRHKKAVAAQRKQAPPKKRDLEYMGVSVPKEKVSEVLEKAFRGQEASVSHLYNQLKKTRRIQAQFHVTLMHRSGAKDRPELWERYAFLHEQAEAKEGGDGRVGECNVMMERVVFNKSIMAIVVRLIEKQGDENGPWECVNRVAHVTVGTVNNSIKPKESNDLLMKWLQDGPGPETDIQQLTLEDMPVLEGVVKGVPTR